MDSVAAGMLRAAAARGDIPTLELLAAVPAFYADAAVCGFTALMAAAVQGQADAATWLLQHGAAVTALKEDGWRDSVLHYAAASGSLPTVRVLLAYGADLVAVNCAGRTAADVAARAGHAKVAAYLVDVASGVVPLPDRASYQACTWAWAWPAAGKAQQGQQGQQGLGLGQGKQLQVLQEVQEVPAAQQQDVASTGSDQQLAGPFMQRWLDSSISTPRPASLWLQVERPLRVVSDMLPDEELLHVDVFIVTYNEPPEVVEPTVAAALNMNYPGAKLTVHVLDDGGRSQVHKMTRRLQFQCRWGWRRCVIGATWGMQRC
jgi:hypothetical protein